MGESDELEVVLVLGQIIPQLEVRVMDHLAWLSSAAPIASLVLRLVND